jgi:type I restriction enzyme S subunit
MAKPEIRLKGFEGEWVRDSFSNSFQFLKNNSLSRAELNYEKGRAKNVHYGDVLIKFGEILDISCSTLPFISNNEIADKQAKESFLQNGDIVFADAAEDNTVGKCSEIQGMTSKDRVVSGLHTIPCRPTKHFEKGYLGYYLNSNPYHNQLLPMIQGTKVSGISKGNLCSTTITYPNSSSEQQSIADYFKSLDSMIQGVTKKIASLKQMKQASFISMFPQAGETTPRVRFKGFEGEWERKSFEDVFSFLKNNSLSRAELDNQGDVMNVHYGDILIEFGNLIDLNKDELPYIKNRLLAKDLAKRCKLVNGDVIFADAAEDNTVGKCAEIVSVGERDVVSGLHTIPCRANYKFSEGFLGYCLNASSFHNQLLPLIQGTKISSISKTSLRLTYILYPTSLIEQQQIALFFRSLDSQVSMQEARLVKLKQIKSACLDKMFV